ncbi:hypothetical protein PCE1_000364 [Barthelona sp. PCE]
MASVKEYRVRIPLSTEEYRIGQLYGVAKAALETTDGTDGIEIIENRPYTDENGVSGQYTLKRFHLKQLIPRWISLLLPNSALTVDEKSWNCYPHTLTTYHSPFLGERFLLEVESMHCDDDGNAPNILNMADELIERRVIDVVDTVNENVDDNGGLRSFHSEKANRGPFAENWNYEFAPTMTAYKAVRCTCRIFPLQGKLQRFIQNKMREVFLKYNQKNVMWMDEWYGMTLEDIRAMEESVKQDLASKWDEEEPAVQ